MPEGELSFSHASRLAALIRKAIGADPYEKIFIHTPQFERMDGQTVLVRPSTAEQLDKIKALPLDIQKRIGLQAWSKKDNHVLMLFPVDWYECIPAGYPIVYILDFDSGNYESEEFVPGKTDNDMRFGALAYGWVVT